MNDEELYKLLERTGALLTGHFKLSSGLHSDKYVQCAKLLQYPEMAEQVGVELAKRYENTICNGRTIDKIPDVIASPAIGGIVIGQEVAKALSSGQTTCSGRTTNIRHIFVEKDSDGKPTLRRGFSIAQDETFAVVEDVITTGKSTLEVIDLLTELGGKAVAILSIIDRTNCRGHTSSDGNPEFDIPFISLTKLDFNTYEPDKCPLCAQNIPIEKPGSRRRSPVFSALHFSESR